MNIKLLSFLGVVMSIGMAVSTNASALPIQPNASDVTFYNGYRDICKKRLNSGINDMYIINNRKNYYSVSLKITGKNLNNVTNINYASYNMSPLQKIFVGCMRDNQNNSYKYEITGIYNSMR